MNRHLAAFVTVALAVALVPASALGIITKVYTADSDSAFVWSFAGLAPVILSEDELLTDVEDMAITSDGQILLAGRQLGVAMLDPVTNEVTFVDSTVSAVEVYQDCESSDIYYVDDDSTTLYVFYDGVAPAASCMSFRGPVLDLLVGPRDPRKGHLIVLIGARGDTLPYIADFVRTGETSFSEQPAIVEEATAAAIDLAFRPPEATIILLDGINGLYYVGLDGSLTHFAPPSIGPGSNDLDIGADRTIYVSSAAICGIYRLTPLGQIISPNLQTTYGCPTAVAALGYTPTPPGTNVLVRPAEPVEVVLEAVTEGGASTAVLTETASRTSPLGNTLPEYAALPSGETQFTYVRLGTTASYEDLIQVDGYLPGTRMFAAPRDTSSREGFNDVTVTGSIEDARGVISRFDEIVFVADTRDSGDVADYKFDRLFEILVPEMGEPPELTQVKAELEGHADEALAYYGSYLYEWAIGELSVMNAAIRGYAGDEIPNSPNDPLGNLAGEMLSRSKTLMWTLSFLDPPTGAPEPDDPGAGSSYSLSCANPARGSCALELAGPAGPAVTVTLSTAGGRTVKTLHEGAFAGGRLALAWDGTDDAGRRVASGVYLTRVVSGEASAEGKIVFIR